MPCRELRDDEIRVAVYMRPGTLRGAIAIAETAGGNLISSTRAVDNHIGQDVAIIDIPAADHDHLVEMLEEDDDVISYR